MRDGRAAQFESTSQFQPSASGTPLSPEQVEKLDKIVEATPSKSQPRPDHACRMGLDLRDPRMKANQWPCFGSHQEAKADANPHGSWVHCKILQCSSQLHTSTRPSGSDDQGGERAPGAEDAQRVGDPFDVAASNVRTLSGHAEEDRCILTGGIQKHLESHASQVKPKAKAGYFKMAKSNSPTGSWEHVHNPEAERRS